MSELEINKALALAIGWTENRRDENGCLDPDVAVFGGSWDEVDEVKVWDGAYWRTFDYRDPTVIWPIAKRYGFPSPISNGDFKALKRQGYGVNTGWEMYRIDLPRSTISKAKYLYYTADTPEKCVALAVIGGPK